MAFTKVVGPGIHTLAQLRTHNIHSAGIITATKFVGEMESGGGDSTFQNVTVNGNLTVQGDTTTLNTTLRNVELLRVSAASTLPAGIITQTGTGDILNLYDSSTEVFTVTDGGKVGINETSPRHHLTVNSGTTNVAIAVSSTDAGSFISYQDNTTGDTGTNSEVYAGATGGSFVIHTDAQSIPRVTVTNGGKVGIGTVTPGALLDAQHHTGSGAQGIIRSKATQANASSFIQAADSVGTYIGLLKYGTGHAAYGALGSGGGALYANSGGGNNVNITIMADSSTGYINFATGGNAEKVRIDKDGCLRVGNTHTQTTSSNTKRIALGAKGSIWGWASGQINGCVQLIDNYYWDGSNNKIIEADYAAYLSLRSGTFRFGSTDSAGTAGANAPGIHERVRITTDGELGIGKTNPAEKLDVSGSIQVSGGYKVAGHPVVTYASFVLDGGNYACRLGSTGTSTLRHTQIYGGGSHIATFDGVNKRLGIGITNPDAFLTIKGDSDATTTPSIRLLDGTDTREVSISNQSGDFIASVHGTDNATHGHIKLFEGGQIDLNNGGASGSNVNRLRIRTDGQVQVSAPNSDSHFSVANSSGTMVVLDTTEPSAIGVGGRIVFGSKYYDSSNTMSGAFIGQYKHEGPSNGVGEYRHHLNFGTRNETDGLIERMRITHQGRVGIGTDVPGKSLHISSSTPAIRLTDTDTSGPLHCDIESVSGDLYLDTGSVHRDVIMSSAGRANELAKFEGDGNVIIGGSVKTNNISGHNLVHNGAFNINQRGVTSTTDTGFKTVDRWRLTYGGNSAPITQKHETITSGDPYDDGFRHSYKIESQGHTSNSQAYCYLVQSIEAQDIANSGWQYTSSSSYINLSFWIRATNAQNYLVYLHTNDTTIKEYCFLVNLAANTWTKVTKSIPGNSGIVMNDDTGVGLQLWFTAYLGDHYTAGSTVETWQTHAGYTSRPDMGSTWWTQSNAIFEITGVQLELGSIDTPFEHRSHGQELAICQRYYQKIDGASDLTPFGFGRANGTAQAEVGIPLTVPLRKSPDLTCATNTAWGPSSSSTSTTAPTVQRWTAGAPVLAVSFSGHSGLTNGRVTSVHCASNSNFEMSADL